MALFLQSNGYAARALTGGYDAWKNAGLPLVPFPVTQNMPPASLQITPLL